MRRMIALTLALTVLAAGVAPALAETTLEKIARTETLTIGTRTGSPPFAYVNSKNEWVGFSIDLVEQLVLPAISQKVGKTIKLEKKESTPPTRIPLSATGSWTGTPWPDRTGAPRRTPRAPAPPRPCRSP